MSRRGRAETRPVFRRAGPLLFLGVVVLMVACGGGKDDQSIASPQPTSDLSVLTPVEVYSLMAGAITQSGYVFHMTYEWEFGDSGSLEVEVWVDVGRRLARHELRPDLAVRESSDVVEHTVIVVDDVEYFANPDRSGKQAASTCLGADAAVSAYFDAVLGCQSSEQRVSGVETGLRYEDRGAVAVVTEGRSEWPEEAGFVRWVGRLFLDERSFLPLGVVSEVTRGSGDVTRSTMALDTEFVRVESLPSDLFDPGSIGYLEPR